MTCGTVDNLGRGGSRMPEELKTLADFTLPHLVLTCT